MKALEQLEYYKKQGTFKENEVTIIEHFIKEAVREEREECAKLAEKDLPNGVSDWGKGFVMASQNIAQAIRGRK